jgi:hypothetical protein
MKAAISLPDPLFAAGEQFARKRKLTRSRLYALALAEYLALHEERKLTERINLAVRESEGEYDTGIRATQVRRARQADW